MTLHSDPALRDLQREVQRLLGQCILALQAYELQVKAIVAASEISGPGPASGSEVHRKTLGELVNRLLHDVFTSDENLGSRANARDPAEIGPSFHFRMQLGFATDDMAKVEAGLRELVCMRNELVHHFLEQHELGTLAGCQRAEAALLAASVRIRQHLDELREWAGNLNQVRAKASELVNSDAFRDFIVHGKVPWSNTVIVEALHKAAATLAVANWTLVSEAERWISKEYPDEDPSGYGCSSWRQVIHESGHFELQYRQTMEKRAAWYRVRKSGTPLPNLLQGWGGSPLG